MVAILVSVDVLPSTAFDGRRRMTQCYVVLLLLCRSSLSCCTLAVAVHGSSIKEEIPFHMDNNQNPQKSQTTSET